MAQPSSLGPTSWQLRYAPHLGFLPRTEPFFKESVGSIEPIAQIDYIASLGFAGVADRELKKRSPEQQRQIGDALERHGLEMGAFDDEAEPSGSPWRSREPNDVDVLRKQLLTSIETARRVHGRHIGISGTRDPRLPLAFQLTNMIENLKWAAEMAEKAQVVLCVESTSELRAPGMLLQHIADSFLVVQAVASPAVRLLFDTVHVQLQDGDLTNNFRRTSKAIQLIQIADSPDRCEPGSGEINFVNFLRAVKATNYTGLIELEHFHSRPGREGEQNSLNALRVVDRQL
jgi:hydroxypyruvate isomerase